jgi:RNA polymerase sigma factor (sigma-70 family)
MADTQDATPGLLHRWHMGDASALTALVQAQLPWLRAQVERRLGDFLRGRADADDYLQEVVLDFLRDGPRFQVQSTAQLRTLLARIVENTLRDRNDWFRARRRNFAGEVSLPTETVLQLDPALQRSTTPSRNAARSEVRDWVRLGIELLEPEDRKILLAREYEDRSFVEIGAELGMTPNSVRMRWVRAVGRLAELLQDLRAGRTGDLVEP